MVQVTIQKCYRPQQFLNNFYFFSMSFAAEKLQFPPMTIQKLTFVIQFKLTLEIEKFPINHAALAMLNS